MSAYDYFLRPEDWLAGFADEEDELYCNANYDNLVEYFAWDEKKEGYLYGLIDEAISLEELIDEAITIFHYNWEHQDERNCKLRLSLFDEVFDALTSHTEYRKDDLLECKETLKNWEWK